METVLNPALPTVDHAITLGRVYVRLAESQKAVKAADRGVKASWVNGNPEDAVIAQTDARESFSVVLLESWSILLSLPRGTTARGGATPQSVALHFFSGNANRDLKARMTPADARRINKVSFGV